MKILLLGLVLMLSAPSFAKCFYNTNGSEFTPFNDNPVKIGSREIIIAIDRPNNHVITIKGLDGITHFYGGKNLLVDLIEQNNRHSQVFCEN